jgi:hypothetical protein
MESSGTVSFAEAERAIWNFQRRASLLQTRKCESGSVRDEKDRRLGMRRGRRKKQDPALDAFPLN